MLYCKMYLLDYGVPLPDVFTASCAAKSSNASYAGMMKLVDRRDLGDVTSVKIFANG